MPLSYATELLAAFPSLGMRGGLAVVELVAHGLVTITCAAAGWMVWTRAPDGLAFAAAAVGASGVVTLQSLFWTVLPRQIAPGDRAPLAALAIAHTMFWLALIGMRRR